MKTSLVILLTNITLVVILSANTSYSSPFVRPNLLKPNQTVYGSDKFGWGFVNNFIYNEGDGIKYYKRGAFILGANYNHSMLTKFSKRLETDDEKWQFKVMRNECTNI